jgi:DNA-binding CsgD family transcriptional regulator
MDDSYETEKTPRILIGAVLFTTMVAGAVDLYLDAPDTIWSFHVLFEILLVVAAMIGFVYLWRGWLGARSELRQTQEMLTEQRIERDAWRANAESALAGLGKAIDDRFRDWGLTETEKEIGMLLLKGKSHKEIAFSTGRSERTVRQHAVSVYQKSRLAGRAELSAFFLDGVMLPANRGLEDAITAAAGRERRIE